jgi:UDP-N-acetylglucosamine--N-acetylmuramyl-(pentapeptide) pyrophosphoryl-undecaprenol N-acetylglucosamine transferase
MLPFNLARACLQSWQIIRRLKPNIVLGMGGYITFPGGLMCALLNRPLVLHEANSIAGSANRYLSKIATKTLTGFPNTLAEGEWVGNPIRGEFESIAPPSERYAARTGQLTLLVVGGSLGAAALNETIPAALALIPAEERPRVLHQAGEKHITELKQRYAELGVAAEVHAFIEDMAEAYAAADLVICRSGAMTVSEIAACGVAACFVPFPFAIDDHQTANAEFLSTANAAKLWPQTDLNPSALATWLQHVRRPELMAMAEGARALAKLQATERVAAICAESAGVKQ